MTMIQYIHENDEVLYCREKYASATMDLVRHLKSLALRNERQRVRICMHDNKNSDLHEMLILHTKNCYVRPHAHLCNDESITVFEGEADLIIFDNYGNIESSVKLTKYEGSGCFYYKIKKNVFHMLIIKSEFLVFKEVAEGPFSKSKLKYATWSPDEISDDYLTYITKINSQI